MEFSAPASAAAHLALRRAVIEAGFDDRPLRQLLWLINAHPGLVAHAEVFGRLLAILESETFTGPGELIWMGPWSSAIDDWRSVLRWIVDHRGNLATRPGLERFDKAARHATDHPLLHAGVSRHAIVAALWNRHQDQVTAKGLPDVGAEPVARRYAELQGVLVLTYMDCRFRTSSLEAYEQYADEDEWPTAPVRTAPVGLAVREFSHSRYARVIAQLPVYDTLLPYVLEIPDHEFDLNGLDADARETAERYLPYLKRYFQAVRNHRRGVTPSLSRKGGSGGGGTGRRRPGYIHFNSAPGVLVQLPGMPPEDPDLPHAAGSVVELEFDADGTSSERSGIEAEASGLAPQENQAPILRLYAPEDLGRQLSLLRLQRLAVEMQAQSLPFAYTRLTARELTAVWGCLNGAIVDYLDRQPRNLQQAQYRATGALMLKTMLCLGQSLDAARQLSFCIVAAGEPLPDVDGLTLVLHATPGAGPDSRGVIGFLQPGLMPHYRTEFPESLDPYNRPLANTLLLPDSFGLGEQLHRCYLARVARPNQRVFGIEPEMARRITGELIKEIGEERVTRDKLARVLDAELASLGYDATLRWIITGDASNADEPRMHYTRVSLARLRQAYARASQRLARRAGHPPFLRLREMPLPGADTQPSIGARFVLAREPLKQLITRLRERLRTSPTPHRRSAICDYHDDYVLYVWLLQSLHTSLRAVRAPNAIYHAWDAGGMADGAGILAGLSDKDTPYSTRARAIRVSAALTQQFDYLRDHLAHLRLHTGAITRWHDMPPELLPLLVFDAGTEPAAMDPGWIRHRLEHHGLPIPPNFHRAFLRTELLERGVHGETIDAFLGHGNAGELPFQNYSTYDYGLHWPVLESALQALHDELGLQPLASRLVPYPVRYASG